MKQPAHHRSSQSGASLCPPIVVTALLLGVALSTSTQAQQPEGSQEHDAVSRAGIPGGQMLRGTVSAVSPDHLTMKTENGEVYQVVTSSNTRIMRQRQPIKAADIKPGDGIGAAGVMDAPTHTLHALMLFDVSADDLRKAQENLGKTYITGRITAIDDLRLTIHRPDGVSQVIEVDEGTSFRKGGRGAARQFGGSESEGNGPPTSSGTPPSPRETGEAITLADVKVGDTVFATGALHSGIFHPTELHVGSPRRPRPEGSSATPQAPTPPTP